MTSLFSSHVHALLLRLLENLKQDSGAFLIKALHYYLFWFVVKKVVCKLSFLAVCKFLIISLLKQHLLQWRIQDFPLGGGGGGAGRPVGGANL